MIRPVRRGCHRCSTGIIQAFPRQPTLYPQKRFAPDLAERGNFRGRGQLAMEKCHRATGMYIEMVHRLQKSNWSNLKNLQEREATALSSLRVSTTMGVKRYTVTIQILVGQPCFFTIAKQCITTPQLWFPPSLSLHQVQCPIKTSHVMRFTPFYLIELTYGGPVSTS